LFIMAVAVGRLARFDKDDPRRDMLLPPQQVAEDVCAQGQIPF